MNTNLGRRVALLVVLALLPMPARGVVPAGPATVQVHLATGHDPDATAGLLGGRAVASLTAGSSRSAVSTFTLPRTTTPRDERVLPLAAALGRHVAPDQESPVVGVPAAGAGAVTVLVAP